MAARLFGTDGVRGVAGELLSAELALALGKAATRQTGVKRPQVLIIRDTRESGEMLQAALAAGVSAAGGDALLGGVLPTPAAPLLIGRYGFDLAVVLSASHNPYRDNGIKFFAADGYKLSDGAEEAIEAELRRSAGQGGDRAGQSGDPASEDTRGDAASADAEDDSRTGVSDRAFGHVRELRGTHEDYLRELHTRFQALDLTGMSVLLDCANGATHRVAPEIFRRLGADVTVLADAPDGRNINAGCGSTHIEQLAEHVKIGGHRVGFAFDGDGDRVLAVDDSGEVVDGDELMALAALHLHRNDRLPGGGVAVTVMTNYGFHTAMAQVGIEVATTSVGDRYVLEELRNRGWALGGEQSGHIIEMGFNRSGDGIASALLTLEALAGSTLSERHAMAKLPQRLVGIRVKDRSAYEHAHEVKAAVAAADRELAGRGRVLVRPSGTEPLIRVMVEAPTDREAEELCTQLATLVERELA
jgi:phosphoglucosamine mutase